MSIYFSQGLRKQAEKVDSKGKRPTNHGNKKVLCLSIIVYLEESRPIRQFEAFRLLTYLDVSIKTRKKI